MFNVQVYIVEMDDAGVNKFVDYLREREILDGSERYIRIDSSLYINRLWIPGSSFPMDVSNLLEGMEVRVSKKIPLILNGSGSFHHLTYGFCRKIVDTFNKPYTIIHIDSHSDGSATRYRADRVSSTINCASFYPRLMVDSPYAEATLFVTGTSRIYSINERGNIRFFRRGNIRNTSEAVDTAVDVIKTESIYPTVDLDVLSSQDVKTDWSNGAMELDFLIGFLEELGRKKRMIGADICGLKRSGRVGTGFLSFNSRSLDTCGSIFSTLLQLLEQ